MIPRLGEVPEPGRRYRPRPGAYVILPRGNSVLLTLQWDDAPEFQLPGGGVDPGEAMQPALHREVFEETGWRIGAPRRLGAFRRFVFMPEYDLWAEKLCHIYVARPVRKLSEPLEPDHTAVWMSQAEALTQLGNAGDRAFLRLFMDHPLPV